MRSTRQLLHGERDRAARLVVDEDLHRPFTRHHLVVVRERVANVLQEDAGAGVPDLGMRPGLLALDRARILDVRRDLRARARLKIQAVAKAEAGLERARDRARLRRELDVVAREAFAG